MSDATLRAAVFSMLTSVPGVGSCYDSEQPVADETFISAFKTQGGAYFGWDMTRESVANKKVTKRFERTHGYRLRFFYGLKGIAISEKAFSAIVDAVLDEFMQNQVPGSARQTYPQANMIKTYATVFTVACHYAEISLDVPEIIDPDEPAGEQNLAAIDVRYFMQPWHAAEASPPDAEDTIQIGGDQ
jgi:hypothetical protein